MMERMMDKRLQPLVSRRGLSIAVLVWLGALAALLAPGGGAVQAQGGPRWVTAWSTSQQALGNAAVTNATVRMYARVTAAGDTVRLRFDNTFGTGPLTIGKAYAGLRRRGATLVAGSNRPVLFKGSAKVSVPPGGSVVSDPVPLQVTARQDVAVSVFVPDAGVRPSQHSGALVTSHMSAANSGDVAADESAAAFTETMTSTYWLKAIDVMSASSTGTIVAFGDSITDGSCTTLDAHDRWQDWLAVRLALDAQGRGAPNAHKAVVNEGIGGNTVTGEHLQPPPNSPPGVERLDRDVLSHAGVTHVVLFMGTNDIRRDAPVARVTAGMQDIVKRVKAKGLKIVGVTIIPRHNRAAVEGNTGWDAAKTARRNEVNEWIRTKAGFDGVIDFDRIIRDPADPDLMQPAFNCDDIHPTPRGYYAMGSSVPLTLFQ
jgi:lysophospholipase L1-like esterase